MSSRPILFLILLLVALTWAAPAAAQGQTIDLADYERLLRAARAAAARGDRLDLDQLAPPLTQASGVLMPGGAVASVDNGWLSVELASSSPDLPLVAARLGALIDALAVGDPPDPAAASAQLEQILSRPPFSERPREPSWLDQMLQRLLEWLFGQLEPVAEPMVDAATGPPGTLASWLLIALAAALIIAVLVVWLRGLRRATRAAATLPSPAELAARDTADAHAQAAALARAGDFRGATRLLALAALLWLDERGALPYNPHQTNREHLQRLRQHPELGDELAPVVETADRVWYGGAPLDAAGYAAVERQVAELRRTAEESKP
jgi:hypothetical protein